MECRVQNLDKHMLALDLRGGETLYLRPHEVSRVLREELLYTNHNVPRWVSSGLIRIMEIPAPAAAAAPEPDAAPEEAAPEQPGAPAKPAGRSKSKGEKSKG